MESTTTDDDDDNDGVNDIDAFPKDASEHSDLMAMVRGQRRHGRRQRRI